MGMYNWLVDFGCLIVLNGGTFDGFLTITTSGLFFIDFPELFILLAQLIEVFHEIREVFLSEVIFDGF